MNIRNQSAFTLMETIIYVGIITIVVTAFISFALNIADIRTRTLVEQEVQANGRFALNMLSLHIKELDQIDYGNTVFGSHPGVLEFTKISDPGIPFIFDVVNNTLRITEGTGSAQAVTSDSVKVTQLVFQEIEPVNGVKQILIRLAVQYDSNNFDPIYDFSQRFQTSISVREL